MKIIEWNINQRASKETEIKDWVIEEIKKTEADIIVLTEFKRTEKWKEKLSKLSWYYILNNSIEEEHGNEILIAIKKDYSLIEKKELFDDGMGDFLQIKVVCCGKEYTIIGYRNRILVDGYKEDKTANAEFKKKQFENLNKYLQELPDDQNVIVVGDFNFTGNYVKENETEYPIAEGYSIKSPQFNENASCKWSFVHHNKSRVAIDFAICKNVYVKDTHYSWDYLDRIDKKPEDWKSECKGTPDHAMLVLEVK